MLLGAYEAMIWEAHRLEDATSGLSGYDLEGKTNSDPSGRKGRVGVWPSKMGVWVTPIQFSRTPIPELLTSSVVGVQLESDPQLELELNFNPQLVRVKFELQLRLVTSSK